MKISALDIPESVAALSQMKEELPEGVAIEDVMRGLKQWTTRRRAKLTMSEPVRIREIC